MNCYCSKCNKTMDEANFYTYKNGQHTELCKKCLTLHIDNFDPNSFLWLLEKMDVPYIPEEWNTLRDRAFAKNPNLNGMSVFGRYLSKMKLKQWNSYSWADTERLKAESEERKRQYQEENPDIDYKKQILQEQFDKGEISRQQYETLMDTETLNEQPGVSPYGDAVGANNAYNESNFMSEEELYDAENELTQEDKIYLALKWGRLYKPNEWIQLEQLYNEFLESFTIEGAARLDTLKMICKTSLKMNQSIDCGDIDGYQKLSRVYDALMKSAKFTEAQRKEEKNGDFDCVGVIVNFAESKKGGGKIPRHKIDTPLDIVDEALDKLKDYYTSLIKNDSGIRQEIENWIKKREILAEQKRDQEIAKQQGLVEYQLTNEDFINSKLQVEEEISHDDNLNNENAITSIFQKVDYGEDEE